jgi:hypothetical protein
MRGGRVLCGYFGVKDYFASFDNNDENADESKGGLFDVNNYLSSLGNNSVEEVDNDSAWDEGSTLVWSSQMQQQESGLFDVNNYLSSLGNNAVEEAPVGLG